MTMQSIGKNQCWMRRGGLIGIGALLATLAPHGALRAQGVLIRNIPALTAEQSARGKTAYAKDCASCHGQDLSGGQFAGSLRGVTFSQNWGGKTAEAFFTYVSTKMPPAAPDSLGDSTYAEIAAYILDVNGTQPGDTELPTDAKELAGMTIPRGATVRSAPVMPYSPLVARAPEVKIPSPLEKITPVTDAMLQSPPEGEWLLWRRTYDDHGFSPLAQINRATVGSLRAKWAWTMLNGPNESTPLVHDGVIFVQSYGDRVQALNAVTGDLLWQYSRKMPAEARIQFTRNIAIYRDRVLMPTSDGHVVALDVKTGKIIWDQEIADYRQGWQVTAGPLVAKGVVMQGIAGQSPGGCAIVGLDFETGKEIWRFHTIARPGEFGGDSWNGLPLEKRSGASVWTTGSYDPQLNLAYFGTGQTYDTGPMLHPINKPGITNDGLYTDTTLAFNPETGKLAWHFQHVKNDQWDLDWAFEQQVINLPVNGASRKLVVTSGKMALYDALDAATGQYVFSKDLGIQNVVTAIDPKTGEKTINPDVMPGDGKPHMVCPHPGGGRDWVATSYNAQTKILYVPMQETCMDLIPAPPGERGNLSSGVNWFIRPRPDGDGNYGRIAALNLETKKVVWSGRQRAPETTCTLATAGGVVFAGDLERYVKAYDDRTGAVLWQVRLNDVPNSCPITFSVGGKQYLAVTVGSGGPMTATYPVLVPEIENPPEHGAAIWVFELPEKAPAKSRP
jgi:PQQ-dependent dehydrogenase (methanol/ethanol family)